MKTPALTMKTSTRSVGKTPRSRSQFKKMVPHKGLVIRNTLVKYQSSSTHCSKVFYKVKVFTKLAKLRGEDHRVNNNVGSWYRW